MPLSDIPLEPSPVDPHRPGVVLFDVPAQQFAGLAVELRRFTQQKIQFRWLPTEDEESGRVFVQIESPPALALWRSMDAAVAYTEQSPGVWVQLGCRHPRPERLRTPKGHLLLVRALDTVEAVPAGPFVEETDALPLAAVPGAHAPGSPLRPISTRLRLVRAEDREPARLWVLREDALPRLTAYCRTAHQH
ncbi:MAG: hypothetical protein J2P46_13415, partial [Zavarzinella sp.]|nr:hypothetical protein [Zavarzinella sp.]